MNHFVGTLSFRENKAVGLTMDTIYEIIDGQQRITTLFILLKVLIDKIDDQSSRDTLQLAFIGQKNNLKLRPLGIDGDFLNNLLFDIKNINIDKIIKRSQKSMFSGFKLFSAFANPLSQIEIEQRIIFIRDRMEVLVFNVENQAQAVKMFSIINDRGLPLRVLDKTKSILMLYSTLHLKEKLNNNINDSFEKIFDAYDDILVWKDKLGILGRIDENTIFTQHYYTARRLFRKTWNNRDGAETIFDNLKNHCEELKDKSEELEKFIIDYINDFEVFSVGYSNLVKEIESKVLYHKPFRFLEFTATLYPLILRLYIQDKLDELLHSLESIEVRVYKLRGTNPVAGIYSLSSHVAEKEPSIDEIKMHLINFSESFVNNHVLGQYLDGAIHGNGAVKYILSEYSNDNFDINTYKTFQVEHIFSKNPNYDSISYGFAEDYDYEKNRIGNLGLLEQELNGGLGNLPPINKVSGYLNSIVTETRYLAGEIQKGNYCKDNVDERRKRIIAFCIDRFKLN